MKYFGFFLVILSLHYNQVRTSFLECQNVEAEQLSKVQSKLQGQIFWNVKFVGETVSKYPTENSLGNSAYQFSGATVTNINKIPSPAGMRRNIYNLKVDGKKAIFESMGIISSDSDVYDETPLIMNDTKFKFALRKVVGNGKFYIYQSCDQTYAWVQIPDVEMNNVINEMNQEQRDAFVKEIDDKLSELKINGKHSPKTGILMP